MLLIVRERSDSLLIEEKEPHEQIGPSVSRLFQVFSSLREGLRGLPNTLKYADKKESNNVKFCVLGDVVDGCLNKLEAKLARKSKFVTKAEVTENEDQTQVFLNYGGNLVLSYKIEKNFAIEILLAMLNHLKYKTELIGNDQYRLTSGINRDLDSNVELVLLEGDQNNNQILKLTSVVKHFESGKAGKSKVKSNDLGEDQLLELLQPRGYKGQVNRVEIIKEQQELVLTTFLEFDSLSILGLDKCILNLSKEASDLI